MVLKLTSGRVRLIHCRAFKDVCAEKTAEMMLEIAAKLRINGSQAKRHVGI